ncbi:MAG: hypothetical protein ACK4X2_07145 [Bacteroidota bacterium]|jgi:hypothetical protein
MNRGIFYFILAFSALSYTKTYGQKMGNVDSLTNKQKDKLYLKQPGAEAVQKFKKSFTASWNKTFINFTDNSIYLLAGMNFSNQAITAAGFNSSFNYNISDKSTAGFKPGYFAGFRVDGLYKDKRNYSFQVSLNKIATANNYKDAKSLTPFLGSFSNFKADDQFLNLSMAMHYKKLLAISDTSKFKFYFVLGPSLDTRLSKQSADNLVNKNYTRFLLRGDVGFEFENKNFYTLFLHYKQGLTSFTKSPINTNINIFELGMMIKAIDLF